jgi:hypothetical protein
MVNSSRTHYSAPGNCYTCTEAPAAASPPWRTSLNKSCRIQIITTVSLEYAHPSSIAPDQFLTSFFFVLTTMSNPTDITNQVATTVERQMVYRAAQQTAVSPALYAFWQKHGAAIKQLQLRQTRATAWKARVLFVKQYKCRKETTKLWTWLAYISSSRETAISRLWWQQLQWILMLQSIFIISSINSLQRTTLESLYSTDLDEKSSTYVRTNRFCYVSAANLSAFFAANLPKNKNC